MPQKFHILIFFYELPNEFLLSSIQWYNFDDIRTKSIAEQDVVTNDAYILFYQRQSSLFNSSQSSSSDSSNAEHWVFR